MISRRRRDGVARPDVASPSAWVRPASVAMAVDTVGVLPVFLTGALAVQLRAEIGLLGELPWAWCTPPTSRRPPCCRLGWPRSRNGGDRSGLCGSAAASTSQPSSGSPRSRQVGAHACQCSSRWPGVGTALTRTRIQRPGRSERRHGSSGPGVRAEALLDPHRDAARRAGRAGDRPDDRLGLGLRHRRRPHGRRVVGHPEAFWELDPPKAQEVVRTCRWGLLIFAAVAFGLGSSAAASLGAYTVSTAVAVGDGRRSGGVARRRRERGGIDQPARRGPLVGSAPRQPTGSGQLDARAWSRRVPDAEHLDRMGGVDRRAARVRDGVGVAGFVQPGMVKLNPVAPGAAVGVTQTGAFVGAIVGPARSRVPGRTRCRSPRCGSRRRSPRGSAAVIIFVLRRFMLREPARRELRAIERSMMEL